MLSTYSLSTNALADGTASVRFATVPTGLVWIVGQISGETIPARSAAVITIRLNGRFVSSSPLGAGASASGPPYLRVVSHDNLDVTWINLTPGDVCIATLLYSEYQIGAESIGSLY